MSDNLITCTEQLDAKTGERGAALVMTLLVAMLLLAAGGALILTTSRTAANMVDATAEAQAYYAAEAGLQATLNILRGHITPDPLIASPSSNTQNRITFRNAIELSTSNSVASGSGDPSTYARLSRWLPYTNKTTSGTRVSLSDNAAYSIEVSDPNDSDRVAYSTTGIITGTGNRCGGNPACMTFQASAGMGGVGSATILIEDIDMAAFLARPTATNQLIGRIRLTTTGVGGYVAAGTRFTITVNQTKPHVGTVTFTGTIVEGVVTPNNSGSVGMLFDAVTLNLRGSTFRINNNLTILVTVNAGGITEIRGSVYAPEIERLLVKSTGFGPKGARKELNLVVKRAAFDIPVVAPIVVRGADSGTAMTSFHLGNSNASQYTGADAAPSPMPARPTIAVSYHDRFIAAQATNRNPTFGGSGSSALSLLDYNQATVPFSMPQVTLTPPATIPSTVQTPWFLQTADAAREFLDDAETQARLQGRYFTSLNGLAGSENPYLPAFTFVDGNCTLEGGSGLLIVTGTLTLRGNDAFRGIILVLGAGSVTRSGGGGGSTFGSFMLAKFPRVRTTTGALGSAGTAADQFGVPSFDISGGGNSLVQSHTAIESDAGNTPGSRVLGVVER